MKTTLKHPGINATPYEMHLFWLAMDKKYDTGIYSPLHHNNRCQFCKGDK